MPQVELSDSELLLIYAALIALQRGDKFAIKLIIKIRDLL